MPYTFNVKNEQGNVELIKLPIDENYRIFKTFRVLVDDLKSNNPEYDITKDEELELSLVGNSTNPVHKNAYYLIVELCNYLTENSDKYLKSEKKILDSEGNPVKDFNGNEVTEIVEDFEAWKKYSNTTMAVLKDAEDLSLSAYMLTLFSKYCNIKDRNEYNYLFESVLNIMNFTNCDNELDNQDESYVLHILCADYSDRILECRNFS
jgi:hypothetical protein